MSVHENTSLEEIYDHYFQTYYTKLWRQAQLTLTRYTGRNDPDRAAEAVQEVFLVAWQKPKEFLGSQSPVGWLVNTMKFVLQNMVREDQQWSARLRQVQDTLDRHTAHPAPGADLELEGLIPQEELDLLKRLYLNGETYEALAQELGLKKSTLAMRVKKSKEKFRKKYRESEKFSSQDVEHSAPAEHLSSRGGSK